MTTETTETRRMGKKAQRQAEEAARRAQTERAAKNRKFMMIGGGIVGALAVIGLIVLLVTQAGGSATTASAGELGTTAPDQGRDHVNPGQPHPDYNTVPPTSGWHWPNTANWGIYNEPIPNELQLHNLEHGGIMLQYNCTDTATAGAIDDESCRRIARDLTAVAQPYRTKVIVAPYPDMPHRIAVTAWTRIMTMEEVDSTRVRRFIDMYRNKGPEFIPD